MCWHCGCNTVYSTCTLGVLPSLLVLPSFPLECHSSVHMGKQAPPLPSHSAVLWGTTQLHCSSRVELLGLINCFNLHVRPSSHANVEIMIYSLLVLAATQSPPYISTNDQCQTVPSNLERLHRIRAHQPLGLKDIVHKQITFNQIILDAVKGRCQR